MILDDLFETGMAEALPSHIKASDLPPGMRKRLTMKDIEAERPKGAYRFRVGEKEFMSRAAADEFAAGTGQVVEPIQELADQKKSDSFSVPVKRDENENIIDEAGKDACYHKVKSRYKVWPSAYASGALVQCRKQGADNWGTGGKKK